MNAPEWLGDALADRRLTDLCLNARPDGGCQIFADRGDGLERALDWHWTAEELRGWVLEQISRAGRSWDARYPFVDAALASGHRLHVAFPPLAKDGMLVSLRRLAAAGSRVEGAGSGAETRWASSPLFPILREAVRAGDSVLIAGATGSGKTTLASDLLETVPPLERILALEDTPELAPAHPHFLSLLSRPPNSDGCGEVTLRTLLRQALRMRPDRIVLGECRGPEVLDLLQILNTGHRGALATLHANSPRDALRRAELLCLLSPAGSGIPLGVVRELLANGIQWIAQVKRRLPDGPGEGPRRELAELCRVEGQEGGVILLRPIVGGPLPLPSQTRR